MFTSTRRSSIAFLAAALLLLKVAMPWLASTAAHAQGVNLVEVCTVYGVTTVKLDGASSQAPQVLPGEFPHESPHDSNTGAHGNSHCALTGLGTWLASPTPALVPSPAAEAARSHLAAPRVCGVHDACARWMAQLEHAPPVLS